MSGVACCAASLCVSCMCCVSSTACSLCCKTTASTATRMAYLLMFVLTTIAAWIMLVHDIGDQLKSREEWTGEIIACEEDDPRYDPDSCGTRWSQLAVYRVFFGTALFFAFMSLLTCRVESSQDIRAGFQNGFWLVKIIMWIGLIVAGFYIDNSFFEDAFGYIGLVGAFMFMVVQAIYLIVFANAWQQSFIDAEEGGGCSRACVPAATLLLFLAIVSISVCLFVYYTREDGCETNKGLIAFNFVMMFVMAFFSVRSQAAERGLLQASVVSFYTTYLTWSAVANTLDPECQPSSYDASEWLTSTIGFTLAIFVIGGVSNLKKGAAADPADPGALPTANTVAQTTETTTAPNGDKVQRITMYKVVDNEAESVYYHWSAFHGTLMLACFYLMNVLTDWATVRGNSYGAQIEIGESDAPVWVQAVASWITMLIYFWSIGAPYLGPKLCPCRNWETLEG